MSAGEGAMYPTFTRARMPWQRTLDNATILLSADDGSPVCALTPAAAEDLADSLLRHASNIRRAADPFGAAS